MCVCVCVGREEGVCVWSVVGVCVCSWYGVVCARGAVVVVVVGCFRVNTLAWENMMGLVACFVGLCALGND